jgi:hypothetical protein
MPRLYCRLQNFLLIFFVLAISYNCKKNDFANRIYTEDLSRIERFLKLPSNASQDIKALAADLRKREESYHFLSHYIDKNGFPLWRKRYPIFQCWNSLPYGQQTEMYWACSLYLCKRKTKIPFPPIWSPIREMIPLFNINPTAEAI